MGGYQPSVFHKGLESEDLSYVLGIDQTRSEKHLLQFTRRRVYAYTDVADGVSFRKGNLVTDGLGFSKINVGSGNSIQSIVNANYGLRGMGLFQSLNVGGLNPTVVGAIFADINMSTGALTAKLCSTNFLSTIPSNVVSTYTPSKLINLLCHASLNGIDILADGDRFYRYYPPATAIYSPAIVQASTPTLADVTQAGILNGYYAYCVTLVDANNNESLPSVLVATASLAAKKVIIAVTLAGTGGTDSAADGWKTIRLYRTLSNGASTASTATVTQTLLPTGTVTVVSTVGFPGAGSILINGTTPATTSATGVVTPGVPIQQIITYTGTAATTFTGCTGGAGTIATGATVTSQGTTGTAVTASENPEFFHVPGLDITLTPGTNSYTFSADNNDDVTITTGTSFYPLALGGIQTDGSNITYFNGALQTLNVAWVPTFISTWQNRILGSNWNNQGAIQYKSRLYWNDLQDSSQTSVGNIGGWNALNFLDFDQGDGLPIIGQYPGLQGRFYVFKINSTFVLQATGNSSSPFLPTKINSEYGMYHHSIAGAESSIFGRTRDGVASFNGTSYKIISQPIRDFLKTCITPEMDSGVYDFNTKRYYLAVCSNQLNNTFQFYDKITIPQTRNATIVFDANTGTWEIHKNTPFQKFSKILDDFGKEKIFAVGASSDIYAIEQMNIFGNAFVSQVTVASATTLTFGVTLPQSFVGRQIYITDYRISPNVLSNLTSWISYSSTITAISGTTVTVNDPLPIGVVAGATCTAHIQNSYGTIGSHTSSTLVDANNYHLVNEVNYGSQLIVSDPAHVLADTPEGTVSYTSATTTSSTGTFSPALVDGNGYVIIPGSFFAQISAQIPYFIYLTPPFGELKGSAYKKKFDSAYFQIKGSGTLRIRTFIDGSATATQTNYLAIPSTSKFLQRFSYLNGSTGNYMRIELGMMKGSGWFEINEFGMRYRKLGQLRNA